MGQEKGSSCRTEGRCLARDRVRATDSMAPLIDSPNILNKFKCDVWMGKDYAYGEKKSGNSVAGRPEDILRGEAPLFCVFSHPPAIVQPFHPCPWLIHPTVEAGSASHEGLEGERCGQVEPT